MGSVQSSQAGSIRNCFPTSSASNASQHFHYMFGLPPASSIEQCVPYATNYDPELRRTTPSNEVTEPTTVFDAARNGRAAGGRRRAAGSRAPEPRKDNPRDLPPFPPAGGAAAASSGVSGTRNGTQARRRSPWFAARAESPTADRLKGHRVGEKVDSRRGRPARWGDKFAAGRRGRKKRRERSREQQRREKREEEAGVTRVHARNSMNCYRLAAHFIPLLLSFYPPVRVLSLARSLAPTRAADSLNALLSDPFLRASRLIIRRGFFPQG